MSMDRRSLHTLCAAAAAALLWSFPVHAAEASPTPAPQKKTAEKNDTVISDATKSIIETFGDLSRTATKLSETALKLLEAQKEIDEQRATRQKKEPQRPGNGVYLGEEYEVTGRKGVYIEEEDEYVPTHNGVYLGEDFEPPTSGRVYTGEEFEGNGVIVRVDTVWEPSTTIYVYPEERDGGHYVWVPDGEEEPSFSRRKRAGDQPDLSEMTYWRGDSIPMAIPTKRLGRYDRKLYNWLIYPRGQWHISLTANYGELSTDDSELLSLMKDIDIGGKIYSIKPSVSYFFRNNFCAGIRLAFTKGEMSVDNFNVDIDEDMNFNLHDIKYTSDSYAAAIFLQQYFGLSRRSRFAVYNEVELAVGTGNKHFIRPFDGDMRDTRTKTQSVNINYSPGVSIMMMKNAAFNLSFGIFGFHLQNEKQWENGEESGNRLTSGINFRFNIFNINFGVSIVI